MLLELICISAVVSLARINALPTGTEPKVYEKCKGPAETGTCKTWLHKWRFNDTTKECVTFIWGGCGGNPANLFNSEVECLHHCIGEPHTLYPYLTTPITPINSTATISPSEEPPNEVSLGPTSVPLEERGSELTFNETGREKTFMFAQNNTFIQIDGDTIQTFQLRLCREISFSFRTSLAHGLLVYHNVKNPEKIDLDPYALYVIVEKGQLKVVHVFGKHSTSVIVGEGLNRDEWHSVMVRIDVHGARLIARVDTHQEEVYLKGLNHETNYGVSVNLPSVVLVGGLSSEEKLHGVKYIIESFVGCIKNIVLSSGKAASDLLPIAPLVASKHENVEEGCLNKCHTRKNLCFVGSKCVNHYHEISCDCFGTKYEGEQCDIYSATVLTLRGSSYVSYRIYDWKDRVHSSMTRISLMFKTIYDDSVLFFASGESFRSQYIAASIKNNSVYVEMKFDDHVLTTVLGIDLTKGYWHNLTFFHYQKTVKVVLDDQMKILDVNQTLLFDPEIYFGGGPDLNKKKGLASHNNFAGSLKYVFYNDISVLYELKKGNPKVHYLGVLSAEFYETDVEVIPITYPFATSHIWWPINQTDELVIKFDFRSSRNSAVLAYSEVTTKEGTGYWEIRLAVDKLSFDLIPDANAANVSHSTVIKIESATEWHRIELRYKNDEIFFLVDYRQNATQMFGLSFNIGNKIIIGSSLKQASSGLVGCMRDLEINGVEIEPRRIVKTGRVVGEIALDNCKYVDPCKRPNTCEHGGKCFVKDDRTTCDCKGTGYIGKNCHFTEYRKTCEELALLGYTKSDVYLIDIDGNGIYPPAHVKCDFQSLEDATKTIVEHNLPSQVDVRSTNNEDFSFTIKYREFSTKMLQELISHSLYCTQYIKYDCFKAPLELHSATWFTSSHNNYTVDYIGNVKRGTCPCQENKTCEDPKKSCNCDKLDNKWFSDDGYFSEPLSLGITGMYFLQQKSLEETSQGRITLGPLECVETNTQRYVVTFTTSQSYIEVPGWRKGDIAFSFRTTGEKAILLFQPPIRQNFPSFMVALTGENQLTFNFTLSTGSTRELVINSARKLNGGEWHKIWIDYNEYHVRFMINTESQMVDLLEEEEFGPFEGSMFIGGATTELQKKSSLKQGLIGCFRGLVVNGEILDIYSYMSVHLSEIIKDCKPSCVNSPCKNGAKCKELWSTFQCVCVNPWAHIGEFCETNINEKALTFISRESYLKKNYLGANQDDKTALNAILSQNLLVNIRTYDKHALVLYANDHFNNFIHLYITNYNEVVYSYNHGKEIVNLTVFSKELSSGKSIQIAVIRLESSTTLFVNELNVTLDKGILLLDEYSNKPWNNPELEVLSPMRPPSQPTDYFQFNIGGYDSTNLLRINSQLPELLGFIGCVRGLKVGDTLIDLSEISKENAAHITEGVLEDCQMKCDSEPCKNGGVCTENFAKQESFCNCEHTSFSGEFCLEEKGAEFSGEAALQRKYILKSSDTGNVDHVKLQLAFSSPDLRRVNRVMLLIQSENLRSYYLMVGMTVDGYLQFEEDREGSTHTAIVDRNFLNNARHSVHYVRDFDNATLLIDRVEVPMIVTPGKPIIQVSDTGANEVLIGGLNTTDPRFAVYKSYSGCLSNIFIEVNDQSMKPVEEYMLFTKSGSENISVINPQGVRSAQCTAAFDVTQKLQEEPSKNASMGTGTWVEDSPARKPYRSIYIDSKHKEENTDVFIILTSVFIIIIACCIIEVYRTDRQHKRRIERETDESIIWSKEQATKLHESPGAPKGPRHSIKAISFEEDKPKPQSILKNGNANHVKVVPVPTYEEDKEVQARAGIRDSQLMDHEIPWDSAESQNLLDSSDPQSIDDSASDDDDTNNEMLVKDKSDLDEKLSSKLLMLARTKQRQLSFGPPPAAINSHQLDAIAESPCPSPTIKTKKFDQLLLETIANEA